MIRNSCCYYCFFLVARRLVAVCEHSFCGDVGVCIIIDSTFGCICPDGKIADRCNSNTEPAFSKKKKNEKKRII